MPWWGPPRPLRLQPWQPRGLSRVVPRGWAQTAQHQQQLVLQALLRRSLWEAACVQLGVRVLLLLMLLLRRMMSRVQQLLRIAGWPSSSGSEGCCWPPAVWTAWQQWQLQYWMGAPQLQKGLRVLAPQVLSCLLRLAAAWGQWEMGADWRRAGVTAFQRRRWRVADICLQRKSAVPHTELV